VSVNSKSGVEKTEQQPVVTPMEPSPASATKPILSCVATESSVVLWQLGAILLGTMHVVLWLPVALLWLASWGNVRLFFFNILTFRKPRAIWVSAQIFDLKGANANGFPPMRLRECGGGGDCAFYSMAHLLWKNNDHMKIRRELFTTGLTYLECKNVPEKSINCAANLLLAAKKALDLIKSGCGFDKQKSILSSKMRSAFNNYRRALAASKDAQKARAPLANVQKEGQNQTSSQERKAEVRGSTDGPRPGEIPTAEEPISADAALNMIWDCVIEEIRTFAGMENFAILVLQDFYYMIDASVTGKIELDVLYHLIFHTRRLHGCGTLFDFLLLSKYCNGLVCVFHNNGCTVSENWFWNGQPIMSYEPLRLSFCTDSQADASGCYPLHVKWSSIEDELHLLEEIWNGLKEKGKVAGSFPQIPDLAKLILALDSKVRPPTHAPAEMKDERSTDVWTEEHRKTWENAIFQSNAYREFDKRLREICNDLFQHLQPICFCNENFHWRALEPITPMEKLKIPG
jgi:hypothetical protein